MQTKYFMKQINYMRILIFVKINIASEFPQSDKIYLILYVKCYKLTCVALCKYTVPLSGTFPY